MAKTLSGRTVIRRTENREYEDFRSQAIELAQSLTPEWNDFYPFDPGVVLLETQAGMADVQSYMLDRTLNEAHWDTCQLRQSMINQATLINYVLSPPSSSSVDVEITVPAGPGVTLYGTDSSLFAPFQVQTILDTSSESYTFELNSQEFFAGGATYTRTFTEGRTVFQESAGNATGSPNQFFTLASSPVTANSTGSPAVIVSVNGTFWLQVSDFTSSDATDQHFTVSLNSQNVATVRFGDGVNGENPTTGIILANYRVGGGAASNDIAAATVTVVNTATGQDVTVTNTVSPTGGQDAETVDEARVQAPRVWATQDRAVTHVDYEALAKTVNGVWRAKAEWYKGSPLNEAVYVATNGNNPIPSGTWDVSKKSGTGLLGVVGDLMVLKSCAATTIHVFPIVALDVNLDVTVFALPNVFNADVKSRVEEVIEDYIRGVNLPSIPTLIPLSGLEAAIEAVVGVDYVDTNRFHRKPYLEEFQVGIADSTLSSVSAQGDLQEEQWTIRFLSATSFSVEGTVSGIQSVVGTSGVEYTTDKGTLVFTITAGTYANKAGDTYGILTSSKVGNVTVQDKEIPVLTTQTVEVRGGIS